MRDTITMNENEPVKKGELIEVIKGMQEEFSRMLTDKERRDDELHAQRDNAIRLEIKNQLDEYKTVINAHAESIRALAQGSGSKKNDLMGELVEVLKPVIQQKMLGDTPQDDLTAQINQLGNLTVRGTLREMLGAQKLQVRNMLRKGRLQPDEVIASGVEGILDRNVESHARI